MHIHGNPIDYERSVNLPLLLLLRPLQLIRGAAWGVVCSCLVLGEWCIALALSRYSLYIVPFGLTPYLVRLDNYQLLLRRCIVRRTSYEGP